MPANYGGKPTDYRDAARILRGLQQQLNDLEESQADIADIIQLSRQVSEVVAIQETVEVEQQAPLGFTWNISKWDRRDWSDGTTIIPPIQDDDGSVTKGTARTLTATTYTGEPIPVGRTGSTGHFKTGENLDTQVLEHDAGSTTPARATSTGASETVTTPVSDEPTQSVPAGAINLNDRGLTQGGDITDYWGYSRDMVVEPGRYKWSSTDFKTFDGFGLYGKGAYGGVVLEPQGSSTTIRAGFQSGGAFHNITIEGYNPDEKSGMYMQSGGEMHHYVWRVGGPQQLEDRHFTTSSGGSGDTLIANCAWSNAVNNGAYMDKREGTYKYCVAQDNNVSGIRVGSRDGTPQPAQHYIKDSVLANINGATSEQQAVGTGNTVNARGVRMRYPTQLYIDRTLWDYRRNNNSLIQVHSGSSTSWSEVHLSHCVLYNETSGSPINDGTGGAVEIYIDGPVIVGGPGSLRTQGKIIDPDNNLVKDPAMTRPNWDWRAVCRKSQSPVAPYFNDVDGDPTTYP